VTISDSKRTADLFGFDSLAFDCVSRYRTTCGCSLARFKRSWRRRPFLASLGALGSGLSRISGGAFRLGVAGCSCGTGCPFCLAVFPLLLCGASGCGSPTLCALAIKPQA